MEGEQINKHIHILYKRLHVQVTVYFQVAVLCQFLDEVDYGTAFKALQERTCTDAMDQLYHCLWDTTLLEYLISILEQNAHRT